MVEKKMRGMRVVLVISSGVFIVIGLIQMFRHAYFEAGVLMGLAIIMDALASD